VSGAKSTARDRPAATMIERREPLVHTSSSVSCTSRSSVTSAAAPSNSSRLISVARARVGTPADSAAMANDGKARAVREVHNDARVR